jgi:hypothetical protein
VHTYIYTYIHSYTNLTVNVNIKIDVNVEDNHNVCPNIGHQRGCGALEDLCLPKHEGSCMGAQNVRMFAKVVTPKNVKHSDARLSATSKEMRELGSPYENTTLNRHIMSEK